MSLFANFVCAQDVIIKNNKSELSVKVEEITEKTVRFRYFARQDGPVYNLDKSEIFMIIYRDGTRESFSGKSDEQIAPAKSDEPPVAEQVAVISSPSPKPSAPAESKITTSRRSHGWAFGVGYMTPTLAFAKVHGYSLSTGYYKLMGKSRIAGLMIDLAGMDYFGKNKPSFYALTGNALLRFGKNSPAYAGGGAGYGITFVPVPKLDRNGAVSSYTTTSASEACGSVFLGIGMFRAAVTFPSLITQGGYFTVGLYTNPFK